MSSPTTLYTATQAEITSAGYITSFYPLTTPYPAVSGCSSAIFFDTSLAAFGPSFGYINTALSCLPPEATQSYVQNPGPTYTALGPLNCPSLYTTGSTSIINSLTTFVACCPSGYSYVSVDTAASTYRYYDISGCQSPVSRSQLLSIYTQVIFNSTSTEVVTRSGTATTYLTTNTYTDATSSTWVPTTTIIQDFGSSVYGFQVTGYVFQATTTAPTISSAGTGLGTTTTPSPGPTNNSNSSSLSQGAKIGIGVGVSLGAIGLLSLLAAFFLIRRHRKSNQRQPDLPQMEDTPTYTPELFNTDRFSQKPTIVDPRLSTRSPVPHAMPPPTSETGDYGAYDPSKDGNSPLHDGTHEMSATINAPLSLPTVDRG